MLRLGTRFLLFVEFSLDGAEKALTKKEIVVKKIFGSIIGGEFCTEDSAIEAYLIP